VLEVVRIEMDAALAAHWRANVGRARVRLGWPAGDASVERRHASGTTLAIAAPLDRLFTATEINEWALCAALHDRDPTHWCGLRDALRVAAQQSDPTPASADPAEIETEAALRRFERLAAREARPDLMALVDAAQRR
jgi:hypothetical protein